jgi:GYF domain 2
MDWYYEQYGNQAGPATEEQLKQMRASGILRGTTLVWCEGMADWSPMDQALPHTQAAADSPTGTASVVPAMPAIPQEVTACAECGRSFAKSDLVQLKGFHVCATCKPLALQKILEGNSPLGSGQSAWASGKLLITQSNAELPSCCVKCGEPSTNKLKRTLYWHNQAIYLLVLVSPIIYIIVAMIVRKSGKLQVPLCERHLASRKQGILIAWFLVLLAAGCFAAGISYDKPEFFIGFALLLLTGLITGIVKSRTLVPTKIDDQYLHLKGACAKFLELFPPFFK